MLRRTVFFVVPLLLAASTARADEPVSTGKRAVDAARELFDKGMQQRGANDLEGARISFAQSYATFASIATLQNLAVLEYETGRCVDALKHLRGYTRSSNADPTFLETKLPKLISECNAKTGHIRVLVPSGVAVSLDGKRAMDLADVVDVLPGSHVVAALGTDVNESRSVTVAAAQTIEVRFDPPAAGPSARAAITPASSAAAPNTATAGATFWTTPHTWAVGLGVAAVASLAAGTAFGVAANNEESSAQAAAIAQPRWACAGSASASCTALHDQKSTQARNAALSDVGFGLGAALAVAAGVVWFLPSHSERTARVWFAPTVGGTSGGVVAGGSF